MEVVEVVAGRGVIEVAKLCYAAGRPLLLEGRHGVGKSELLERAAAELEIGFLCRDLSIMEPPDLSGLPRQDGGVTRFSPPSFLPTAGAGLLAFEELNRCASYMRAPALQLLTARTLNDYTLPAGWLPVAAINPPEESYEVEDLDPALLSRFVRVRVRPDPGEWLVWARDEGVHPGVVAYVESDPKIFEQPESNPRAWAYVGQLLRAAEEGQHDRGSLRWAVAGVVGTARAAAFFKMLDGGDRPLTAAEVLDYRRHRRQVRAWLKAGRLDLLAGSLRAVQVHLQAARNYELARGNRDAWAGLGDFLADLPGDLCETAEAFLREHDYDLPGARRKRGGS
jgi:MoxR-like ATPase